MRVAPPRYLLLGWIDGQPSLQGHMSEPRGQSEKRTLLELTQDGTRTRQREWARAWLRAAATATSVRSVLVISLRCCRDTCRGRICRLPHLPSVPGPVNKSETLWISVQQLDHRCFLVLVVWWRCFVSWVQLCVCSLSGSHCSSARHRSRGAVGEWIFKCNTFLFFH